MWDRGGGEKWSISHTLRHRQHDFLMNGLDKSLSLWKDRLSRNKMEEPGRSVLGRSRVQFSDVRGLK